MNTTAISKNTADLSGILAFKDDNIISRFTDMFDVSWEEAEDIFLETKKFLYISGEEGVYILDELLMLDEMWHNFICFTKEYQSFGENYFGAFIHHSPNNKAEKEATKIKIAENKDQAQGEYLVMLENMMGIVYDAYGEETVIKWFQIYPVKYSKENIKALRKK